ncbi:olfactory receptor 1052-like [Alligator mississippiensis]|uniref:olfactory receptor 1052-like n=1 Tax=Alligator mississippiensis TaxID=8496 RepID=UPI0003D099CE|nr:olfactory receptor 1052-like [Alligator mississippiensis]
MERNCTGLTEFILLGLTDQPQLQGVIFAVFLFIYAFTVVGNLGMIELIRTSSRLHTPMYFFLSNLSLVDFCYSSTSAPQTLVNFMASKKTISFAGCTVQFFFICFFISIEGCLLAAMAYDRLVAISNPLLYTVIMHKKVCIQLVISSYFCGCVNAVVQTSSIFTLSFCRPNIIDHFFCDIPPVLKLSCSDTKTTEIVLFIFSIVVVTSTAVMIFISYAYIFSAILHIHSVEGKHKAFSTCASHLTSVTILYGTVIFMYLRPNSKYAQQKDKVVSVFYTLVIPMLNPLIYSLRNKEVKDALRKYAGRTRCSQAT